VTAANVHDSHEVPNLLFGDETRFYGDSACRGREQRKRLKELTPRAKDFTHKRAYRNRPLSEAGKATHRRKSKVRAKVEHPFLTLKEGKQMTTRLLHSRISLPAKIRENPQLSSEATMATKAT
jgi:IS5 family transposase